MATLIDIVKKGSADRSVAIRIIDSGDGTPETGVVYDTSGIDLWYRREGAAKVSITEATLASLTTAHADGGFLHVGDGEYRLDLPDAAFATGANYVDIGGTVTGMVVIGGRVRLVNYDPEDTVRLGLTALPNAAADAAGGLAISDAGGLDLDTKLANTNEVTVARMATLTDLIDGGRLDLLIDAIKAVTDAIPDSGALTSLVADVTSVLTDTAEIGAAGAGLTALPWNASWDAEVQSEANDALVALGLDHLLAAGVTGTDVTDNSIFARFVSTSATADWDDFVHTTDSLQAIRDQGDSAWATATGFATHSAADVWAVVTRILTANTNLNDPTAAAIADAVCDEALAGHSTPGSLAKAISDILADTNEMQTDLADGGRLDLLIDAIKAVTDAIPDSGALTSLVADVTSVLTDTAEIGAAGAGLTALPWNASWDAEVQSEVTDGLTAALTEGYRGTGATGSVRDLLYEAIAHMGEATFSGLGKTLKKIDGTTTAKTFTINDASTPTSITETT